MVSQKEVSKSTAKTGYTCNNCSHEFYGTATCPDCGNAKGNRKLAPDHIEQEFHSKEYLFGGLYNADDRLSEEQLVAIQSAKMANEEFLENMRQSYVMNSEVKMLGVKQKLLAKQRELKRLEDGIVDTYPPEHSAPEMPQSSNGPLFGSMSPQAQFMSQLMRMNGENRAEFISQLSDADPQALNTLSNMFVQPQQNPMGAPGMYPGMYPQQFMAPQQSHADPPASPMLQMKEMFQLMKEMQPPKDNSAADTIRDLKDELKALQSRIDASVEKRSSREDGPNPIIQYIQQLEKKIDNSQHQPTFKDQIQAFADITDSLKTLGVMNQTPANASLDDQIKLRRLDHEISVENRQFNLELDRTEIEKVNQRAKESLVQNLFSNGFAKTNEELPVLPSVATPLPSTIFSAQHREPMRPIRVTKPVEIVDEFESDAGTIREVRGSSKQYDNEGV